MRLFLRHLSVLAIYYGDAQRRWLSAGEVVYNMFLGYIEVFTAILISLALARRQRVAIFR